MQSLDVFASKQFFYQIQKRKSAPERPMWSETADLCLLEVSDLYWKPSALRRELLHYSVRLEQDRGSEHGDHVCADKKSWTGLRFVKNAGWKWAASY